jgi:hypothetical protein
MSKTNLLTVFVTVIVVVIVAELLVNDYATFPELQKQITGNVFGADEISIDEDMMEGAGAINFDLGGLQPKSTVELADNIASADATNMQEKALISFGLIGQVGFENVTLQRVPFNGIMFERIDMRDFKSVPVIKQNLLQNNRQNIAEFYEIHAESQLLANEIFLLIKEKALQAIEAGINETNEYGEASYYINYVDRGNTAFLVVKVREGVYALSYKKELHAFIKSLILLL